MRVALVTTDFPPMEGGIAVLFSDLARACSEKCRVTVLAPSTHGAERFDARQRYPVVRLPGPPPVREAGFLRSLARLERAEGLDVVGCASWIPAGLLAYLWWIRRKTPYLVWAHGSEIVDDWRTPRRVLKSGLRPLKKLILRNCAAVVANSHYTRNLLVEQGVSPSLIEVILPAADPNRFTPSPPSQAAILRYRRGAIHCLLTVARLDPHKGHARVLEALAHHLRDIPGVRYLIAGSGPEGAALRRLAASLGVEGQVEFLGYVPDEELPDLYRAADIFVMPSGFMPGRLDYVEGFGIAYLEAAASAKPVVAGASGGTADAVVDGVTGLLVDPQDPAAVGRAIRLLIEDPSLAERLGRAGRERVVTTLTPERMAERVLDVAQSAVRTR